MSTINLIKDNPNGIGFSRFEFTSLPYREKSLQSSLRNEIESSPHNEWLRLFAESGWIAGVLTTILIVTTFARLRPKTEDRILFIRLLIFLVVETLFQFPKENPLLAWCAVLLIKSGDVSQMVVTLPRWLHKVWIAASILIASLYILIYPLPYFFDRAPDLWGSVCNLQPEHWRVCLKLAKFNWSEGRREESLALLREQLRRRPYNFFALQEFEARIYQIGYQKEACLINQLAQRLSPVSRQFPICPQNSELAAMPLEQLNIIVQRKALRIDK